MPYLMKESLEYRRLGDEGVILDPITGRFYRLRPPAAKAWEAVLAGRPESADAAALAELAALGLLTAQGEAVQAPLPGSGEITQIQAHVAFAAGSKAPPSQNCGPKKIWDPIKKKCVWI